MFRTTLQFIPGGPVVTGEWTEDATARKAWRDWIGLYGSDEKVTVRVIETADGLTTDIAVWEHGRVTWPPEDSSPAT
ncbi:hypothetical protein [Streptomyces pseudovenezuelae]|uniref:hypothetical protein n=1 Tax=Streptomyces pseudovenezuelae TaxID=67350 RepID=UPI0036ED3DEA